MKTIFEVLELAQAIIHRKTDPIDFAKEMIKFGANFTQAFLSYAEALGIPLSESKRIFYAPEMMRLFPGVSPEQNLTQQFMDVVEEGAVYPTGYSGIDEEE